MIEFKVVFIDANEYPEIKPFPSGCIFECKPYIGETIQIGGHHFKVTKIVHNPTVSSLHYSQFIEPTILLVEYN